MNNASRVATRRFVAVSDILVAGLDVPARRHQLTTLCASLLDVHAVGLLAPNEEGELSLVAASADSAELLTRYELAYDQGPGVDAFRAGERVECVDLSAARLRWPRFAPIARDVGVASAHGLPCHLSGEVVGALALYLTTPGPLSEENVELGRGLANTLALGLTAHKGRELAVRAAQLQSALESRVTIEQAKGTLAERSNISVDEAFSILRAHARRSGRKMRDVARDVMSGELTFPAERN